MKILIAHNFYQHSGGEDRVVRAEEQLLRDSGDEVVSFYRQNSEISGYTALQTASLPARTIWGRDSYEELRELLRQERPDVAHFHNLLPLISPSVYYACRSEGVPVVQTLHNFRLLCPSATLFRDGRPCEECARNSSFAPAVAYGCYRGSRPATLAVASMVKVHQVMGTWSSCVDRYVALSQFARHKLVGFGLPAEKIVVKPNFLADPGDGNGRREYALFIGRLVPEKGVRTLLAAWRTLPSPVRLLIAGDGPLRDEVRQAVGRSKGGIEWLGQVSNDKAVQLAQGARFLIFPSEWYEGFPVTLVESFACRTPVIAARIGSVAEITVDGETGLHFRAGDAEDLAAKIEWACAHPDELSEMGRAARRAFLAKYTPQENYRALMEVYEAARGVQRRWTAPPTKRARAVGGPANDSKPAVMLVHNFYQQRGGEDAAVEEELRLLTEAGHRTSTFFRHNREIDAYPWWEKGRLGIRTVWSKELAREISAALKREKPDVVHFHNFMPLLSPALYYACREFGAPVVQTLHNYRLLCPSATMYRDGHVCEECLGKLVPWPGVLHKCYRDDRLASAAVGAMISTHEIAGTWRNLVDRYIALTEFARRKFAANGIPEHKIALKPNYVDPDPGAKTESGGYALFVGRLSPEKGIRTLLEGWKRLKASVPLLILGEGPCEAEVLAARRERPCIQWLGWTDKPGVIDAMKRARFLVLPSECYESFPLALVEAFGCALPVVAAALGSLQELVCEGQTGITFRASDPGDLARRIDWAWTHPDEMTEMGRQARNEFESKYTAPKNHEILIGIYEEALRRSAVA